MKKLALSVLAFSLMGVGSVFAYNDHSQRNVYGEMRNDQFGNGYIYKDNQGTYDELRENQFGGGYTYKDNQGGYYEISPNPYTGGYDIRGH